jgi:hypothetical protein
MAIFVRQHCKIAPTRIVLLWALTLLLALSGCSDHVMTSLEDERPSDDFPGDDPQDPEEEDDDPFGDDDDDDDSNDPVSNDDDDDDPVGDDDDDDGPEAAPGSSSGNPRPLLPGDLVINELMIDPVDVPDAQGEYVEIRNNGEAWLQFEGLRLKDWGVDDAPVVPIEDGDILLGPGQFYVICVMEDYWDNGGVHCDATVEYSTWGGGFALSNTEDEVILTTANGIDLDGVLYDDTLVEPGEAAGVDPDYSSVAGNNDLDEWCLQWDLLPFGGTGSPGESNDNCW